MIVTEGGQPTPDFPLLLFFSLLPTPSFLLLRHSVAQEENGGRCVIAKPVGKPRPTDRIFLTRCHCLGETVTDGDRDRTKMCETAPLCNPTLPLRDFVGNKG